MYYQTNVLIFYLCGCLGNQLLQALVGCDQYLLAILRLDKGQWHTTRLFQSIQIFFFGAFL